MAIGRDHLKVAVQDCCDLLALSFVLMGSVVQYNSLKQHGGLSAHCCIKQVLGMRNTNSTAGEP